MLDLHTSSTVGLHIRFTDLHENAPRDKPHDSCCACCQGTVGDCIEALSEQYLLTPVMQYTRVRALASNA